MVDASGHDEIFTGGCQCGRVRYRVSKRPAGVHYCHCRMCQRAVGNLFAALAPVDPQHLVWERGEPAVFASSNLAERGFCRDCGTPLFFRYTASAEYDVTVGSLDHPERVPAERHYGIESLVSWHVIGDDLPRQRTDTSQPALRGLESHQGSDGG